MEKKFNINNEFFNTKVQEVLDTYPFPDNRIPLCVDVGANVGAFSLAMSYYCDKVISIEPFKENYDYMVSMIQKYDRGFHTTGALAMMDESSKGEIIPINKAISSESGKMINMSIPETSEDSGAISCTEKDWVKETKDKGIVKLGSVETISLEDIIKEHGEIDYMKVDCEGCEWDLLYGKDLSKIKMIVTEIHPMYIGNDKYEKLIGYLNNEYDVNYVYHQEYKYKKNSAGEYDDPRLASSQDTEFVFRREGTSNYENNIYVRFVVNNPNMQVLPKKFNNWIRTCGVFIQPT